MSAVTVFDLDSTLADTRPRRHLCPTVDPTSTWEAYEAASPGDLPIPGAVRLARMLHLGSVQIFVVTWRRDVHREETAAWLRRHTVPFMALRMRSPEDPADSLQFHVDYIGNLLSMGYHVDLVVQDQPKVAVAIQQAHRVPVLCVNPCYAELPALATQS